MSQEKYLQIKKEYRIRLALVIFLFILFAILLTVFQLRHNFINYSVYKAYRIKKYTVFAYPRQGYRFYPQRDLANLWCRSKRRHPCGFYHSLGRKTRHARNQYYSRNDIYQLYSSASTRCRAKHDRRDDRNHRERIKTNN